MSDEPAAQAHALLERLFALLHDCRAPAPQLEMARCSGRSAWPARWWANS